MVGISKVKDPHVQSDFANSFTALDGVSDWDTFKHVVYKISSEKLGFMERKRNDWFDENDGEIQELLGKKWDLTQKLSSENLNQADINKLREELKMNKPALQKQLCELENER